MTLRDDAILTMEREISGQFGVVEKCLNETREQIGRIADIVQRARLSRMACSGVGDSELVGRLAAQMHAQGALCYRPIAVADLVRETTTPVMIHSISGNTAVTVAAARLLKTRGTTVLATVGDASSTMAALADASIVLDIPRYPPDAKVPGTVTVTVPLAAAVVVALCSAGMDWVTAARMLQDDINVAFDDAQHAISRLQPVTAPAAVHIVVPETPTAAAEYAQAKTAETIGVGATISGSETWLHVFKHAVTPATLVIGLADSEASASPLYWVSQETALRGGQFVANLPISWSSGRGLAFDSAGDRLPGRRNVFTQLFFVQRLCLELLRVSDWTPFQLHRVDRRQLAGISERSYTFGPARAGSREPA